MIGNLFKFRKIFIIFAVILLFGFILFPSRFGEAQIPFGGAITTVWYCYEGIHVYVGPPVGGAFMWTYSTLSYANGPPTHVEQWLLGLATAPLVCTYGYCGVSVCIYGPGLIIMFHGSSV